MGVLVWGLLGSGCPRQEDTNIENANEHKHEDVHFSSKKVDVWDASDDLAAFELISESSKYEVKGAVDSVSVANSTLVSVWRVREWKMLRESPCVCSPRC
jgi:hypothetical protein